MTAGFVVMIAAVLVIARNPPGQPICRETMATDDVNVIRQLRSTDAGYELELWSEEAFPVRAMPTVLRVGIIETSASHLEFDQRTIVFPIAAQDFKQMETGDPILVHHTFVPLDLDANPNIASRLLYTDGWNLWTFGRFDKSQLDCPPMELPLLQGRSRQGHPATPPSDLAHP